MTVHICGDPCVHASSCAVHNAPALPVGPCDCTTPPVMTQEKVHEQRRSFVRGMCSSSQGYGFALGEAMTACQARPDRHGSIRCIACRVSWDRDDVAACPRQAPENTLYVSALAHDIFRSAPAVSGI